MAKIQGSIPNYSKTKLYAKVENMTPSQFLNIDPNDLSRLPRKELAKAMRRLTNLANKRIQYLNPVKSGANSPALNYLARKQGVNLDRAKAKYKALEGVRQMRHIELRDLKREIRERQKEGRGVKRLQARLNKAEEYYSKTIKNLQKEIKELKPKFTTKGKSVNQLRALFSDIKSFMEAKTSTMEGFEEYRAQVEEELGSYITQDVDIESAFWDAFHRFIDTNNEFVYEKQETNKVLNWLSVAVEQSGARTTDEIYTLLNNYNKEQIDLDEKWQSVNVNGTSFKARDVDFYKK